MSDDEGAGDAQLVAVAAPAEVLQKLKGLRPADHMMTESKLQRILGSKMLQVRECKTVPHGSRKISSTRPS